MIRGLWTLFRSKTSAIAIGVIALGGVVAGILFWGGLHWAVEATNTEEFCISCHEMRDTVYVEYRESVHYRNASGVGAICSDCHVPREWLPKMIRKVKASRELYHKVMGTIDTPEKFEEHRAEMAQRVWATMEANDSLECRNCHRGEQHIDYTAHQDQTAAVRMEEGLAAGDTCISCHKGIAHKLPDLSGGYRKRYDELVARAVAENTEAGRVYTIAEIPFWLDQGEVGEGNGDGVILSATGLDVLDRTQDAAKVRIDGWRQEGADRVMYEMMGQRIFSATFRRDAVERITVGEPELDTETELTWLPVSIDVWITRDQTVASRDDIWDYTNEVFSAACGTCHGRPNPHHFLANNWIGIMKSMERFVPLDKREYRVLQKYLQLHAGDIDTEAH